jgi:L-alanine-DL-glutamate epimerase-like enolase superfamily enzyme
VGKKAGLPLYKLWGAFREEIPAYGSGCWRGLGGDGMIAKAQDYVRRGFRAIKMQAAHLHGLDTDLDNVRRMREALGPGIDIMIDINQGWSADTAIVMGRKFQDYDLYWMEEPVPAEDFAGYRRIAQALTLRLAGGESHFTRYDLRPFFETPCVPILQPDPMRGGLTELRKIAVLADTWGLTLAPHLFSELMVQVMASIPNGLTLEYMGWLDDLWVETPLPVDGKMRPPQRPGHGLAVRPEAIKEFRAK